MLRSIVPFSLCALAGFSGLRAGDWPQWGGRPARNMVSEETGLPDTFLPGTKKAEGSGAAPPDARNVRWSARLGTQAFGTPAVAGGRVFVGTNNGAPRNPRLDGDRSVLLCFEEATGKFLWQLAASKLRDERSFNGDFAGLGICSSPSVEGDRVYVVTGRCEVLCLDAKGLSDGNDGPFQEEGEYVSVRLRRKPGKQPPGGSPADLAADSSPRPPPPPPDPTDADILWRYDMIAELDVWPQDASDGSVLVRGDLLYVTTSNGVDKSHTNIPSPGAPSLIALDKRTGRLVAVDDAGIGPRIFHGTWSSPSLARVRGRDLVLFGGGDGFTYAFDAEPAPLSGTDRKALRTVWRCDSNPPEYRVRDGKPLPYNRNAEGPSEVIGTPVFHEDRVYVTIGQDSRHGPGKGALTAIDATREGDVSATGVVWRYQALNRSFSTPSIAGDLLFVADYVGDVHCLDVRTGRVHWVHRTGGTTMGSTLAADGKVYFGNDKGKLVVLAASKEKRVIAEVELRSPIDCTPVAAGGVLYIATHTWLHAAAMERRPY